MASLICPIDIYEAWTMASLNDFPPTLAYSEARNPHSPNLTYVRRNRDSNFRPPAFFTKGLAI